MKARVTLKRSFLAEHSNYSRHNLPIIFELYLFLVNYFGLYIWTMVKTVELSEADVIAVGREGEGKPQKELEQDGVS